MENTISFSHDYRHPDKECRKRREMKGVDSVYGNGSAQYIGKAIEAFYMR